MSARDDEPGRTLAEWERRDREAFARLSPEERRAAAAVAAKVLAEPLEIVGRDGSEPLLAMLAPSPEMRTETHWAMAERAVAPKRRQRGRMQRLNENRSVQKDARDERVRGAAARRWQGDPTLPAKTVAYKVRDELALNLKIDTIVRVIAAVRPKQQK